MGGNKQFQPKYNYYLIRFFCPQRYFWIFEGAGAIGHSPDLRNKKDRYFHFYLMNFSKLTFKKSNLFSVPKSSPTEPLYKKYKPKKKVSFEEAPTPPVVEKEVEPDNHSSSVSDSPYEELKKSAQRLMMEQLTEAKELSLVVCIWYFFEFPVPALTMGPHLERTFGNS